MSQKIVLASRNKDKLREWRQICAGLPFDVASSLDFPGLPEVIEDGTSALGNATRKALVTAGWTGEIAVADDTTFQDTSGWASTTRPVRSWVVSDPMGKRTREISRRRRSPVPC